RLARSFSRQVRRRDARIDNVPLADTGPLQNPLIRCFHQPLEVGVGEQPRRNVGREAGDTRAATSSRSGTVAYHSPEPPLGIWSPKYSYARAVAIRPRGVRSRKPA